MDKGDEEDKFEDIENEDSDENSEIVPSDEEEIVPVEEEEIVPPEEEEIVPSAEEEEMGSGRPKRQRKKPTYLSENYALY